jgi:hypothetical protein
MSRVAFYNALTSDPILNGYGLNEDTVFPNWSSEERPSDANLFIILRYGDQQPKPFKDANRSEPVTVWVHHPRETSNDFNKLVKVLDRIDEVIENLRDTAGSDDRTLSFVTAGGRSRDLVDDGFNTITKTGDYQLYSRRN